MVMRIKRGQGENNGNFIEASEQLVYDLGEKNISDEGETL
jgi:hypothetical protein